MFNGIQFLALAIASAVIYRYAIADKLKVGKMEKTEWPENVNPILSVFRWNWDKGDSWGSTINFLFALCDIATDYGVSVPVELQYVASPFGSDTDANSYQALQGLLDPDYYVHAPLTLEEFKKHVWHALKVLGRYDSILRLEGKDY